MASVRLLGRLFMRTRSLVLVILALYAFICYMVYTSLPSSSLSDISDQPVSLDRHPGASHEDPHLVGDKEQLRRKMDLSRQLDELRKRLNISLQEMLSLRQRIELEKDSLAIARANLLNKPIPVQVQPQPGKPPQPQPPAQPLPSQLSPAPGVRKRPDSAVQAPQKSDQQVFPSNSTLQVFGDDEPKRDTVKKMMKLAWDSYVRYAWGANELRPLSRIGHNAGIFGNTPMGATIVDALDTLFIMGLLDEYRAARDWIAAHLSFNHNAEVSVFEFNIRYLGGLLSAYSLTGDVMYIDKCLELAKRLLPAFNTASGIPYSLINLQTASVKNYVWASGGSSILAEVGTLHMEFAYLSEITGDPEYLQKVRRIREVIVRNEKPQGMYSNYLNPHSGTFAAQHSSVGALGDSFYEYLFKEWHRSAANDTEALALFDASQQAIFTNMLRRTKAGFVYAAEWKPHALEHKMDHLACFIGGLWMLASNHTSNPELARKYLENGREITKTCHEAYSRSATKLGPEVMRFEGTEFQSSRSGDRTYILRPETAEAYFYGYRVTHEAKYREWGWEMVQALQSACKTDSGYTGIHDVYVTGGGSRDDVQQSYYLAETLKYLYLLFADDDAVRLDQWVFNTEAHPLPVRGAPQYRATPSAPKARAKSDHNSQ